MSGQLSNDVFLSYRREESLYLTRTLYQALEGNGVDAFYDMVSLGAGHFDSAIEAEIASRPYFILVLVPGTLNRCSVEGDWVRREFEIAVERRRTILPVHDPKFDFGDCARYLPGDLGKELERNNSVPLVAEHFDYVVQDLVKRYLIPVPIQGPSTQAKTAKSAPPKATPAETAAPQVAPVPTELQRTESRAHFERGMALQQRSAHEEAIMEYSEAIRLNGRNADAYYRRASAHHETGVGIAALKDLLSAARYDPKYSTLSMDYGKEYSFLLFGKFSPRRYPFPYLT